MRSLSDTAVSGGAGGTGGAAPRPCRVRHRAGPVRATTEPATSLGRIAVGVPIESTAGPSIRWWRHRGIRRNTGAGSVRRRWRRNRRSGSGEGGAFGWAAGDGGAGGAGAGAAAGAGDRREWRYRRQGLRSRLRQVRWNGDRPRPGSRGRYFLDLLDSPDLRVLRGRLSARPEGASPGRRRVGATRGPRCCSGSWRLHRAPAPHCPGPERLPSSPPALVEPSEVSGEPSA